MIVLHGLDTKFRTKASVPIGTPIPMKPSGQKEVGSPDGTVTTDTVDYNVIEISQDLK
jgi:hypothetical protein